MAMQVINRFIHEDSISGQVGVFEERLGSFRKDDWVSFIPPGHVMDHGNHRARRSGMIGHAGMPQADIADHNGTRRGGDTFRRASKTALGTLISSD